MFILFLIISTIPDKKVSKEDRKRLTEATVRPETSNKKMDKKDSISSSLQTSLEQINIKSNPNTMYIKQLKCELVSKGIDTSNMIEKSEFVYAGIDCSDHQENREERNNPNFINPQNISLSIRSLTTVVRDEVYNDNNITMNMSKSTANKVFLSVCVCVYFYLFFYSI